MHDQRRKYIVPRTMWNRITPGMLASFTGTFTMDAIYVTILHDTDSDVADLKAWIQANAKADPDFVKIQEIMPSTKL